MKRAPHQGGFAYIAAVVFLLVLAAFALAALRLQSAQQATIDGSVLGMRADQAARGGLEWALYQIRDSKAQSCTAIATRTLNDFVTDTGFKVTVTCAPATYNEGLDYNGGTPQAQKKNIFELTATACNGTGASCPDAGSVTARDYVERKRSVSLCGIEGNASDC